MNTLSSTFQEFFLDKEALKKINGRTLNANVDP